MAAALPAFQLASEMGPSPSREAELEERCRRMAAENELLREMVDTPDATPSANRPEASLKPEEKQKLLEVISNLGHRIEDLEIMTTKQAREIEELKKQVRDSQKDIEWIQESFPPQIAESKRRLKALEEGPDPSDNATVQNHITALFDHMEAVGRKQVSFREASKCLKLSKSRVLQFKAAIALDARFIIVHSESHKQKSLIRLRKYFDGGTTVQPPN
jgi:uncharacterized coiled-coil protein SlyX